MQNLSRRTFLEKVGLNIGASTVVTSLPAFAADDKINTTVFEEKKLNIALCGLGRYAEYLAEGLLESKYCKLTGIITGTPAKEVKWQKQYNISQKNTYNYQNFDEIIDNKEINLVYVVLPNAMHKEYVIRAAKAGKHVIVEKPMAVTAQDCQEMIDACKRANVQLAVGYRLHFEPYNLELKRLGQEKIFGQVRLVEASLGYNTGDGIDWHVKKALSGGGPLTNLGVYCVQAARYILGEEPISVTAQFGAISNKIKYAEVEESITFQLNFPSGAVSTHSTSYSYGIDRVYATAENGSFELSPAISYGPFVGKSSAGPMNFPQINQQATQCDEIAKVILANQLLPNHITGEEGQRDVKVLEAIYKAARTGKKVIIV